MSIAVKKILVLPKGLPMNIPREGFHEKEMGYQGCLVNKAFFEMISF